ncbi:hypothetical protein NW762_012155 [Fusarium torreyae]|uniref:Extracellular membrane protein CFEM domain-containing protein n=1 Tax=Fusarium torreyae TaxID=1237075 RepID=A0A9W8VBM7_9HYPO|nr:hypothetical protein NW762_012155 [Fusarium torreyae]
MTFRTVPIFLVLTGAAWAKSPELNVRDSGKCPDNWGMDGSGDEAICCFGTAKTTNNDGEKSGFCCVQNIFDLNKNNNDCSTAIDITESDYTSLVAAASKSVMAEASGLTYEESDSPATNTAEPTDSDSTGAAETTSATQGSTSSESRQADETDTENVGPIVTGSPMAKFGGAVAAAVLLAL